MDNALNSAGRTDARSPEAKHEQAVARTLEFAEDAACRGDFTDALAWLATLEAIGRRLPSEYLTKREEWRIAALT
ncbi:MAG TPA: hypothetical protein VE197_22850 [Mycobacterium sp.]|nr:hypothetical protein [Mycobacterium sp.]